MADDDKVDQMIAELLAQADRAEKALLAADLAEALAARAEAKPRLRITLADFLTLSQINACMREAGLRWVHGQPAVRGAAREDLHKWLLTEFLQPNWDEIQRKLRAHWVKQGGSAEESDDPEFFAYLVEHALNQMRRDAAN